MSRSARPFWLLTALLLAVPASTLLWWNLRGSPDARPTVRGTPVATVELPEPPVHSGARNVPVAKSDDAVQATPGGDLARSKTEAARALARSDPKRRRALLREALSADPEYEPALQDLSLAVLEDENHGEARALSARCLAVSPDNDTCRMVSNYALPGGPEADAVGREAEACLAATPKDAKCLATSAGYSVMLGDLDRAAKLTEALTEVAPGAKQTLFASARVASATGHYDEARHDLEEACRQGLEQACFRAEALRGEGW